MDEDEKENSKFLTTIYTSIYTALHKNLTISSLIFACLNISLGVFLAVLEWYWVLAWFFILGLNIALYICLEANKYFTKLNNDKTKNRDQRGNLYNKETLARRGQPSADTRSIASSSHYGHREDISMDYLDMNKSNKQLVSDLTSYSNNNSSRISTINVDYSLRHPATNAASYKSAGGDDDYYVSNKDFIQSGLLSYSQKDKTYFKRIETDH